ncbi:HNH endonuclease [bacterium]|nr:HNH endonuclease [bacterium]
MRRVEILALFKKITVWKKKGQRAPHKPLLALMALADMQLGRKRLRSYQDIEEPLRKLLQEFGPIRRSYHPEYPFWRLQNDELWEVRGDEPMLSRKGNTDPPKSELRRVLARGGFTAEVYDTLKRNRALQDEVTRHLLDGHFPETLHQPILDSIGLSIGSTRKPRSRDPRFRTEVLRAYQNRCAVCGGSLRLGDKLLGIDAAHIRWHQADGPDAVENGLALCTLHHRLLDAGAYTLSPNGHHVEVSEWVTERQYGSLWLLAYHGTDVAKPINSTNEPSCEFVDWHRKQVFKKPARECYRSQVADRDID